MDDVELHSPYPSILVCGKGRKQRRLPLWKEATRALRAWLAIRGTASVPEVFVNGRGEALSTSGLSYILKQHVRIATKRCPSLSKKRASPHVMRHSTDKTPSTASLANIVANAWKGTLAWVQAVSDHDKGIAHISPNQRAIRQRFPLTAPFDGMNRLE
jgi:integrase